MAKKQCPECGYKVDELGLARHRGSNRCQVRSWRQAMKAQGYVRVIAQSIKRQVKKRGGTIKEGPVFTGGKRRIMPKTNTTKRGYFAHESLIKEVQLNYLPGYTTAESSSHHTVLKRVTKHKNYFMLQRKSNNRNIFAQLNKNSNNIKFLKRNYKTPRILGDYFETTEATLAARLCNTNKELNSYLDRLNSLIYNNNGRRVGKKILFSSLPVGVKHHFAAYSL